MKNLAKLTARILTGVAALCLLAACALEPPPADSGAASGGTGRVFVSISGAGDSPGPEAAQSAARTLLPWNSLKYKLEFTRQGESEPALIQTVTETSAAVDLEAGEYTLMVSASNPDSTVPVAGGSVPVTVQIGESVDISVSLTVNMSGSGSLDYTVTLPPGMTLAGGLLTLYPLSYSADPVYIDLSAGFSGSRGIPSGYYRVQLSLYGSTGGTIQFAGTTGVVHIVDSLGTPASYSLAAGDFAETDIAESKLYFVENSSQLNSALTSILGDVSGTAFTILVKADFSSPPLSLTDPGYDGKTINLRDQAPRGCRLTGTAVAQEKKLIFTASKAEELI